MADSYEKLRQLPTEDLIKRYDQTAKSTVVGLSFIREEIARREAEKQTQQMLEMTRQMRTLTIVMFWVFLVAPLRGCVGVSH